MQCRLWQGVCVCVWQPGCKICVQNDWRLETHQPAEGDWRRHCPPCKRKAGCTALQSPATVGASVGMKGGWQFGGSCIKDQASP